MIKLDFFNDSGQTLLSGLCEYFHLNIDDASSYFLSVNPDHLTPDKYVRDFMLNLSKSNSNEIEIVGQHMTTCSENDVFSFRETGVLDLKSMLQLKTPLSSFLLEYGIVVDVDNRVLILNNKEYPITNYGEECVLCINDKTEKCTGYSRCDYRKCMDHLGLKLYKYGATVEFFINTSLERMSRYSSIRRHPEILVTLENVIKKAQKNHSPPYNLGYAWMRSKNKCCIVEFRAKLSDMETFAPIDWRAAYDDCDDCISFSGYTFSDYMQKSIPQTVFDNYRLLRLFFSIYYYDCEELGSLLSSKTVAPESITRIIAVE